MLVASIAHCEELVTTSDVASVQSGAGRVPTLVWVLTAIFGLRALLTVIGSFVFAFPMGGLLGTGVGVALLVIGVTYAIVAWRMRLGERWVWLAAVVSPLVNQVLLTVADLSLYGAIPPEDYPFIVVTAIQLVLLFLPSVRRFFVR